ncbi:MULTISPECIES: hypothetical protein [Bacillus]|uniref:hypothetical protein n=1 Tax=Bacillus TaxID=1386 RepID=UPI000697BB14|nr:MULTISPECIES: hypothetical protein [Bacillus]ARJ73232.1 hypothetical protein B7941_01265 [Bacillus velezensis]KZE59960.1 hypothetical protein AV542_02675 [Bacillus amyloliquefaciens]MCQ9150032.1 hypothetical protein [Bacillus amyloliquefaciens]MDH3085101.1 hypothetical protein [Bacillus velezensis]QWQ28179.1 hypothetical protein JNUCC22_17850 [Bacillus sp. JNUCC-22]
MKKVKYLFLALFMFSGILFANQHADAAKANHKGWTETKAGSNIMYKRAVGQTTWKGKYHYTRAQVVAFWGTVDADSGRVWGKDKTKAVSPWTVSDFTVSKTFYGS